MGGHAEQRKRVNQAASLRDVTTAERIDRRRRVCSA